MIKCAFCGEDLPNETELGGHIATRHPEKGYSAEAVAEQMGKMQLRLEINHIAAQLTQIIFLHQFATVEAVMETYKKFRKELEEWV